MNVVNKLLRKKPSVPPVEELLKPINFDELSKVAKEREKSIADEEQQLDPRCDVCGNPFEEFIRYPFVGANHLDTQKETTYAGNVTTIKTTEIYGDIDWMSLDFCSQCLLSLKKQYFLKFVLPITLLFFAVLIAIPILGYSTNVSLLKLDRELGIADSTRVTELSNANTIYVVFGISTLVLCLVILRVWFTRIYNTELPVPKEGIFGNMLYHLGNRFMYTGVFSFVYLVLKGYAQIKASRHGYHNTVFTKVDFEIMRALAPSLTPSLDQLILLTGSQKQDTFTTCNGEFLAQLTQEERVAVSNLNPLIYVTVIHEKKGESTTNIIAEDDRPIQLLRKLETADLERLHESVKSTLDADKAASQGDIAEAMRLYLRTTELNPFDDLALMSYGVALAKQGNLREGIKWVEKALRVNPKNERAFRNLQSMKANQ